MKEPIPGQALCDKCGIAPLFWVGNGRRPTLCDECSNNPPRRKGNKKLVPLMEERSKKAAQEHRRAVATKQVAALLTEYAVRRMAVGIGIAGDKDLKGAAIAGGVRIDGRLPTDDEIAELASRAREDIYTPLREARETAAAQSVAQCLSLLAISLCELEPMLSPTARPQALYMLHKTLEGMGGGKLAYPKIVINKKIEIVK